MNNTDLLDPVLMGNEDSMYGLFDYLREHDPVSYVEDPAYLPFWSLSKYEDIKFVGRNNDQFLSAPRAMLQPSAVEDMFEEKLGTRNGLETLIHMDSPKHLKLRRVTRDWFLPRNINRLDAEIQQLAKEYIDKMQEMGDECDFVKDVALHFPLRVIMKILGVPKEDEAFMLKLTQELFGNNDPELSRGTDFESGLSVITDFFDYFGKIIEDRKINPTDDLASVIANADVDGKPMDAFDQISYFIIAASAGHDTTSATISSGMKALIEHPEQLQKWAGNPELDANATKELLRWTSPVRHMVRTATADIELRGKEIKAGDSIAIWFPAANRDQEIIHNANILDIERDPKLNLHFGYGAHMCLGQHLATLEVSRFFRELLPRLSEVEFNGDVEGIQAIFVGGLKSMPLRYRIA
ncbi:MAG: cytochrome P450 [Halieaceae bacterium]|jgi:cytochrome P450